MTEDTAPPRLDPSRHALFLDFDGTLVDFAPTPDAIEVRPGTTEMLARISERLGGALALISGRRVADLDRFLSPLVLPASGVHGQEMRATAGEALRVSPPSPELDAARARIAEALRPDDPIALEDKGGSLVLHFRRHPEEHGRAGTLARQAVEGLDALHAVEGHAIFEVRQKGVSKAGAIVSLSGYSPFAGRLPVFIGDDSTDEDGFRAAADSGGFGIKVGAGETAARYRLADVAAVHGWLARCI